MKPKIFISSTIYDFKDLRSALKFYLEKFGYEVLLSEYNDFTKRIDENSYRTCLDSIKFCDYFVLFVGSRVGGYYDLEKSISITTKEYQTAYELVLEQKIKILSFVREEIWVVREDRKALEKLLTEALSKQKEIDEFEAFSNYKSNIINDAEYIFNFVDMISRKDDMTKAIEGKGEFPKNNWVHQFKNFDDIINVINMECNIKGNILEEIIKFNLKAELNEIVKSLLTKINGTVIKHNFWANSILRSISDDLDTPSSSKYEYFKEFQAYILIGTSSTVYMETRYIEKALNDGIFLEYDGLSGSIKQSLLSRSLSDLKSNIEHLKKAEGICQSYKFEFIKKFDHLKGSADNDIVKLDNIEILPYLSAYQLQENVLNLSVGIIKHLEGNPKNLENVILKPVSPFKSDTEKMKYENPTHEEVENWIKEL